MSAYDELIERHMARLLAAMKPHINRLEQVRKLNSPRQLAAYEAQLDRVWAATSRQLRAGFDEELRDLAVSRHPVLVKDALAERARRDKAKEHEKELPVDVTDDGLAIVFYGKRLLPILQEIAAKPRNRARDYESEARKIESGLGWRAADPEVAAFLADYVRSLAAEERTHRPRGRKTNVTALSVERRLVNAYLPRIRAARKEMPLALKRSDEVEALAAVAAEFEVPVDESRLAEAIHSWDRTNEAHETEIGSVI